MSRVSAIEQPAGWTSDATGQHLIGAFDRAKGADAPYRHWLLEDCLPAGDLREVLALPFPAPGLEGVSGTREAHNATRKYFDVENQAAYPCVNRIAAAFQSAPVTTHIERTFGVSLAGNYLRIEFAQDIDGFWLVPHTDIGVKVFTFLLYLSPDPDHAELGTDIYDAEKKWVGRSPFASNAGMIFIPSNISYHGFEARPIKGVRKSLIVNYVTNDWRAREQLAYPTTPIPAR